MKLTGHKTVAMFMHYVHTEDKPVRDAAELVASRRQAITGARRLRRPRHEQEDAFGGAPAALAADYPRSAISETVSGKFGLAELAKVFTLPWSAYALLISVKDARGSVAGIPSVGSDCRAGVTTIGRAIPSI